MPKTEGRTGMIERAIDAFQGSQQVSGFTPLILSCNHKLDGISLGLLGFTESQCKYLFTKLGNGTKEFHFKSLAMIPISDLFEISGDRFSARILIWALIENLVVSHNLKCLDDELEYLELDLKPQIFEEFSVEEIGLSARSLNVLRRARVSTVSQLNEYSREELMNLDNLGISSVNEIERVLVSKGYRRNSEPSLDLSALMPTEIHLDALQLSTRTYNALMREGINSLSALMKIGPKELSDIRNFGQKSVEEVLKLQEKYVSRLNDVPAGVPIELNKAKDNISWAWQELRKELDSIVSESTNFQDLAVNQFSLDGFDYNTSPILARHLQGGPITLNNLLSRLTSEMESSDSSIELPSAINFISVVGKTLEEYKIRLNEYIFSEEEKRKFIEFENRYSDDEIDLLMFDSATLKILNIQLTEQWAFLGRETLLDLTDLLSTHFITHSGPWEVLRGIREFFAKYEVFPSVIGLIIGLEKYEGEKNENLSMHLESYLRAIRPDFVERDLLILKMRINRETLDAIGKVVGVTRERVRQIIKKISPIMETTLDYSYEDRSRNVSEVFESTLTELFSVYGAVYQSELANCLGVDEAQALAMTPKKFQKFIIDKSTPVVYSPLWTREHVISLIQKAGTYYFPLRMADYDYLLEIGEIKGPSVQRITQKFGVWSELCIEAGVEPASTWKLDYVHRWSEAELISFAERFFLDEGTTGSANGYDEWRTRQTDQVPSGPHVRNQFGTWLEVRRVALESIRIKKGKAIRA